MKIVCSRSAPVATSLKPGQTHEAAAAPILPRRAIHTLLHDLDIGTERLTLGESRKTRGAF